MELTFNIKYNKGMYQFLSIISEIITLSSENYTTKSACNQGLKTFKTLLPVKDSYERKETKNGRYFFIIKANNGQWIATSSLFYSRAAMDFCINWLLKS